MSTAPRLEASTPSEEAFLRTLALPQGHAPGATLTERDFGETATDPTLEAPAGASLEHSLPALSASPPRGEGSSLEGPELELHAVLGRGGMGTVYLTRQRSLQREVAVKVLNPEQDSDAAVEAMRTETRILAALEHPNIVPVHLLGTDARGHPALVMKRIEGVRWSELVQDPAHPFWSRLPYFRGERLEAHVRVLMDVCNAVHFAHSRGVVHRDLKADNVMIGAFGEVYLMDWGIACTLSPSPLPADSPQRRWPLGTPTHMAPEMVRCEPADARTDVFLLGALLHEVLTGTPRHRGTTLLEVLSAALRPAPVAYGPELPAELAALANAATQADPAKRPPTAASFRNTLADHLEHRGSLALAQAAAARLQELTSTGARLDAAQWERTSAECRFGLAQALTQWPANPVARRVQRELLTLLLRRALENGDLQTAAGLLAELPDTEDSLHRELAQATERERERALERERLQSVGREHDLGVGAAQRRRFLRGLGVLACCWSAGTVTLFAAGHAIFSHASLVLSGGLLVAVVAGLTVYGRRTLLHTAINRRVTGLPLLAVSLMLAHRVLGVLRAQPPAVIINDDTYLLGYLSVGATLLLHRGYGLCSLFLFAGALTGTLWPAYAQPAFSVSITLAVLAMAQLWQRQLDTLSQKRARTTGA